MLINYTNYKYRKYFKHIIFILVCRKIYFKIRVKITKNHSKNSDLEYPKLGHWYSVTKMVRIYPNFG